MLTGFAGWQFTFEEAGEAERGGCSGGHLALDGFQIAAQEIGARRPPHMAHLHVEEQLHLTLREGVAATVSIDELMEELAIRSPAGARNW